MWFWRWRWGCVDGGRFGGVGGGGNAWLSGDMKLFTEKLNNLVHSPKSTSVTCMGVVGTSHS